MANKINIVLLTDCLVDPNAGGAERKIYELAGRLDKNKFNVILASLDCEGDSPKELVESMGCKLYVFRVARIYGISGFVQGARFKGMLRKEKVDILQTYHFSSDIWGTFFARLAGVRVIISNRRDMGFWRKDIHVKAYRLINRWVNRIIVVSKAVKDRIVETEGLPENKIEVIYNGVDIAVSDRHESSYLKKKLGISQNDLVIMHAANFKPVKGHSYLLEAMAALSKEFKNLKLVLIGEDEFNGALQKMAQELKIAGRVLFLGKRNDVRELLMIADICVLPSLSEGMSNAILEYMAAGKAVVATSVGGNPETVEDGVTGILVEPKNAVSLSQGLRRLILDSSLREKMGIKGRERAESIFDIQQMHKKYEALFVKILEHVSPN